MDVVFARVLLVVLAPVVVAAPPRWAVLAWLVMTNLDATGSGQASNLQVGWLNAVKAVALPAWLSVRLHRYRGDLHSAPGARAWLALAAYAALSAVWSDFPLAGGKLAAGMLAILLAAAALDKAARAGLLDDRVVLYWLAISLGLAVFQTVFFADGSFGFAGRGMPQRLTSFVAAQQYAALLVAFIAWVLWTPRLSTRWRTGLLLALLAALAANGSRTWSAGALAALLVHALVTRSYLRGLIRVAAALIVLASVPAIRRGFVKQPAGEPANRLTATASAFLSGQDRADGMGLGTMRFRLRMYSGTLKALRAGTPRQWIFGHGAAAGGRLAVMMFPYAYRPDSLDPNRVIHNEWLRVAYEWGALGMMAWLATLVSLGVLAWRRRHSPAGGALLAYMPALLLGLSAENVIDGAGNAVTAGLVVLVALAFETAEAQGSST